MSVSRDEAWVERRVNRFMVGLIGRFPTYKHIEWVIEDNLSFVPTLLVWWVRSPHGIVTDPSRDNMMLHTDAEEIAASPRGRREILEEIAKPSPIHPRFFFIPQIRMKDYLKTGGKFKMKYGIAGMCRTVISRGKGE